MTVSIVNTQTSTSEMLCMHCNCHLENIQVKALIETKEHELYVYSCPECPNITFEFSDERDLAVLNHYLMTV